jgi:transglutaminase-like putative cysteine protease
MKLTLATPDRTLGHPVATLALTALSAATVVTMCRVFADWEYLPPMLTAVLITQVLLWALRATRLVAWIAVPAGCLLAATVFSWVYYRSTLAGGFLPSGVTFDAFSTDVRLVIQQFPTAVAPVSSVGNFANSTAALVLLCVVLADNFAFRAMGRAEALVPTGVLVVFVSALAADRHRVTTTALWLAAAVLAVACLRAVHSDTDATWMGPRRRSWATLVPLALVCAGGVSIGAAVVGPRLPGAGEPPMFDTRNREAGVIQVVSPLVDIRSQLVRLSSAEMFTVRSDAAHYWKLASLSVFDGSIWRPSDQDLDPADEGLGTAPPNAIIDVQDITIGRLGGNLVPAAATPISVRGGDLSWAEVPQMLVVDGGDLQRGDRVTITSAVGRPSADELRSSTANSPPDPDALQLPDNLPAEVFDLARQATAGAATPYDQARALQDWFIANFVYDLTVQKGHNADSLLSFLTYRRGYCEHFAASFGAMARTLGLPTRVVVGFTPGELQGDGLYHVYGRQAHAWVEVWFDRFGWVAFDPTPGRGSPDNVDHTGRPPQQQIDPAAAENDGNAQPGSPTPTRPPDGGIDGSAPPPDRSTAPTVVPRNAGGVAPGGTGGTPAWPVWIVVGLVAMGGLWYLLAPRFPSSRGTHPPAERVGLAWQRACRALQRVGAPAVAGATPTEYARKAATAVGADRDALASLAREVTGATYAPDEAGEDDARRAEECEHRVVEWCRQRMGRRERVLDRMLLR